MGIPETPASVSQLGLMKRLEDYAEGRATWLPDKAPLGQNARKASRALHTRIVQIVEHVFAFIMDRSTARELDTFTMHDRTHGRKVAHLMWHILTPERQAALTPPEIGMLVLAAHLHDAGMALSRAEREARLAPESDLWDRAEASPTVRQNLKRLRQTLAETTLSDTKRIRVESERFQAEEALLALDTRERHALRERYEELINQIRDYHDKARTRVPDIEECFSFDGDSFKKKLIEVCVSHNEDADALVERDREQFDRPRFPRDYPVGLATVDTHLVAAALRLADILDFDRERTPPTLFHYLVPSSLSYGVNISELEWSKHLSISNWEIEQAAVVFRGRCKNHIVHHAVVQFCRAIEEEIASTRATFGTAAGNAPNWPFALPETVRADIHEEGYHYVPYQFELDDGRVYNLLMGRAIYDNPLVAVRELVQNAVDACSYRDALTKLAEPHAAPDTKNRITIRYEEPSGDKEHPVLRVIDTGTGMDAWLIERWFLKVGRSYYSSTEFARDRVQLRRSGVDFAPVSEFGIGFLSCFLLADRVDVETAMWEPIRGDTRRRHLEIDGPTRLIRIREDANPGLQRLRGTRVSLTLVRGRRGKESETDVAPAWEEVKEYLDDVCQELPYRLNLERTAGGRTAEDYIDPRPLTATVRAPYDSKATRIPVDDPTAGILGEIAIVPSQAMRELDGQRVESSPTEVSGEVRKGQRIPQAFRWGQSPSVLLRGGFNVGNVPGLPESHSARIDARVRLLWRSTETQKYSATNLSRTGIIDEEAIGEAVTRAWITHLIERRAALPEGFLDDLRAGAFHAGKWLERYSALEVYELARNGWHYALADAKRSLDPVADWEAGKAPAELGDYRIELAEGLLDLVLPRVAPNRYMDEEGDVYVMPPSRDWREVLRAWHGFVSSPVSWSRYVSYTGRIADHLHHSYHGLYNKKYADRLGGFTEEELDNARWLFSTLLENRRDRIPTDLDPESATLLNRLIDVAGDLEVSSVNGVARLDSFQTKRT
jgi:hypothetical protein